MRKNKIKICLCLLFLFFIVQKTDFVSHANANSDFSVIRGVLVEYRGNETELLSMPEGITEIGTYVFDKNTRLTKVVIPDGVTKIGNGAFSGCSNLKEVKIPESVHWIGVNAFVNCKRLKSIEIPDRVETIFYKAFYNCISLESVKLPADLEKIGTSAFGNCTSLQELQMPDNKINLDQQTFWNCRNLKSLSVPGDLRNLKNNYIFASCNNLVIYGRPNSSIAAYAKTKHIPFVDINSVKGTDTSNIYRISFYENGGESLNFYNMAVIPGQAYGTLPVAKRTGYEFMGWYSSKSGGKKITAKTIAGSEGQKAFYARWSKVAKPGKAAISVKSSKSKTLTVNIKRIKSAKGYEILYSTNKNFKGAKKVTTESLSKTIQKLKVKSTYYVKVRAYKIDSAGKKVYGSYSSDRRVKIAGN